MQNIGFFFSEMRQIDFAEVHRSLAIQICVLCTHIVYIFLFLTNTLQFKKYVRVIFLFVF